MSEYAGERVPTECPSCSPDLETVHEVLATGGGQATLKCTDCGHVHKEPIEDENTREFDVVVSQDGESFTTTVEADADETVAEGEEFIVDTEEAIMQVRVTSVETGPEQRESRAEVTDVETVWTRAVDNVSVGVTVHPKEGGGDETRSVTLHVPGDHEFVVGDTVEYGDDEFEVTGIHVRENAVGDYKFPKLGDDGDTVRAKDVKRVYGRDETTAPWSAW